MKRSLLLALLILVLGVIVTLASVAGGGLTFSLLLGALLIADGVLRLLSLRGTDA